MKKLRRGDLEPTAPSANKQVVGAALLETTSMLMWSESNREVADSNRDLMREIVELRHAIHGLRDELRIAAALSGRQERRQNPDG